MAVGFRTSTLLLAVASLVPIDAYAFTTVIDTPPAPAPSFLGANTQVNIHQGGHLADKFCRRSVLGREY